MMISYKIVCAPSEDSDQHLHSRRLVSICCQPEHDLNHSLPTECPVKTDQAVRMHMLIRVFAVRPYNLVGKNVPRLIF